VLGRVTSEEAFKGTKCDVSHFSIFGNLVYFHVPSESRKKIEPIAVKGIFVGYNKTTKAYRVYVPTLRRIMIRSDVWFEEGKALRKSLERENSVTEDEEQ